MNELDAKLKEIAENLLVQTKLVERFEQRTEDRLAQHEENLAQHRERMDRIEMTLEHFANASAKLHAVASAHEERVAQHDESYAQHIERMDHLDRMLKEFAEGNRVLQAALNGLVETVDRFIRGQQGDGRG